MRSQRRRAVRRRDRRAGALAARVARAARCPPTTTRCCGASWMLFPDWYVARHLGVALTRRRGRALERCSSASREQPRAAARVRPSRLPFAQPDGDDAQSGRARFPGCRASGRSPTTSCRCCATRTSSGTRSAARLGGPLLGARRAAQAARRCGLRRVLARLRMDGRAAAAEGARHLRATAHPRRQGRATSSDMPRVLGYLRRAAARYRELAPLDGAPRRPARRRSARRAGLTRAASRCAMILAAGRGERMRPLSDATPKPLLVAGGKPLIVWQIEALARAGFADIVINAVASRDALVAALGDGSRCGVRIRWSHEAEPLETAGGIATALPLLAAGPVLIVSGDIWTRFDYSSLTPRIDRMAARRRRLRGCTSSWSRIRPIMPEGDFVACGRPRRARRRTAADVRQHRRLRHGAVSRPAARRQAQDAAALSCVDRGAYRHRGAVRRTLGERRARRRISPRSTRRSARSPRSERQTRLIQTNSTAPLPMRRIR